MKIKCSGSRRNMMQVTTNAQASNQLWWSLLIRGIVAVLFGLAALLWPGLTVLLLVSLFGAYALIDGVISVGTAFRERKVVSQWWLLLIEGLVGIAIGVITFVWPAITALILLYLIAIWAIVTGLFEIGAAFSGQERSTGFLGQGRSMGFSGQGRMGREWTLAVAGIISVILGILLIAQPGAGLLTVVLFVAIYAIVFGILLIIRAFQFRLSNNMDIDRGGNAPMQERPL
jgi:uncharacterized membrane protein HdeD (DUF308 family)